jgi:hypothetical protein
MGVATSPGQITQERMPFLHSSMLMLCDAAMLPLQARVENRGSMRE